MINLDIFDGDEVWKFHATYGFPLSLSIPILAERGFVPSWDKLLSAAKKDGTNLERLVSLLSDIAADSYPEEVSAEICKKLPILLSRLN